MKIEYWKMLNGQEQNEIKAYSAKIGWGFNETSIRKLFKRYIEGDLKEKAKVCYLLEGCNYHTLCGYLADGMVADAKKWIDDEFPIEETDTMSKDVVAWVMEVSDGKYLRMNSTEDGNGTFFDMTSNLFDAYWNRDLDDMKEIRWGEFSAFEEGFPKYHKIRFSYEYLDTAQDD